MKEQVILITGASRGIGHELALLCAERGAHVHVCARSLESLDALASHPHITAHACDIREGAALDAMFARIHATHGHLDVLVNNASVLGPIGKVADLDDEAWQQTIDINLNGTFFVTRRALQLLEKSQRSPALIINLSSSVGRKARANWASYCISKYAVEGFTQLLTDEWDASSLVAVSLNPGGTATEMRASAYPEEDPNSLPSAHKVAQTAALLIAHVGAEQAGARFSSRSLFSLLEYEHLEVSELPREP